MGTWQELCFIILTIYLVPSTCVVGCWLVWTCKGLYVKVQTSQQLTTPVEGTWYIEYTRDKQFSVKIKCK